MAFVACTDKQKKHRIKASGNLLRTDYYCPHKGCDAVLTLVDCDDEIRTDHFRTKTNSFHSNDCPYKKNNIYLFDNGFTNVENQILEDLLNKLLCDFEFLDKQIRVVLEYSTVSLSDITSKGLMLVGYKKDSGKASLNEVYHKLQKITNLIKKYSVNKFKYNGIKDIDFYAIPLPFTRVKLYEDFFADNMSMVRKCANLLKTILCQHWYSKKWADFYFNLFSHSMDEIKNIENGFFFSSLETCIKHFAQNYNLKSIESNKEYMGAIFKFEEDGEIWYYYTEPRIGNADSIGDQVYEELHQKDIAVADIHTHGAYPFDPGPEVFSPKDLMSLVHQQQMYGKDFVSYLVTPNGSLKKTDGVTQVLVSTDIPKDKNDPLVSVRVDILYNPLLKQYCKIPLYAKSDEDLVFSYDLKELID